MTVVDIDDLRQMARRRLPKTLYDYVEGSAYNELALRRNRADLDVLALTGTVMRDVSTLSIATTMAGDRTSIPLALGPVGMAELTWPNGEIAAARAAEDFGVPFCLSTFSIALVEDVKAATARPFWSRFYTMRQGSVNESLIRRAAAADCSALVMIPKVHVRSQRWRENRNGLTSPIRVTPAGVLDMALHLPWALHILASGRRTCATMQVKHPEARNVLELTALVNANLSSAIDAERIRWVR